MRIMCVRLRIYCQEESAKFCNLCVLIDQCKKICGGGADVQLLVETASKVGPYHRDSPPNRPEWFYYASNESHEKRKDDDVKFSPATSTSIKDGRTDSDHVLFLRYPSE